jgi:N-acetylmuramic acid 6-phosphate etherase
MNQVAETLLLGVDGGGSKTVALLADGAQRVLGRGTAGPANYQTIGAGAALAALDEAIRLAFEAAGRPLTLPTAAGLGIAGIDRPEDRVIYSEWLARRLPGVPAALVNDAELVLAAGTPGGWGLAVVCGTGTIVYGRDPAGRLTRASGWGPTLGDEGSGYWLGRQALQAVMRAADGRGPATSLSDAVLTEWGLARPEDLVSRVYGEGGSTKQIAALARVTEAAAQAADPVAVAIVQEAGRELALATAAVVRRLSLPAPVPCALAGGVLVGGTVVRRAFLAAAAGAGLSLEPVSPVVEPALGALRLARARLG